MLAKYAPMTKALCQLVSQAVADAENEVIGEIEVVEEGGNHGRKRKVISEEVLAEEAPVEEAPVEEAPVEETPRVRMAIDLKCMEKLKEAKRWCEEVEIFGT